MRRLTLLLTCCCLLLGGRAYGAVAYESISAVATTTTTSLAMNAPSGVQVGETLIACVACENALQADTPSGWTLINYRSNSNALIGLTQFWRIADGTGADTPTITMPGTPSAQAKGVIVRISGAHASAPLDTYVDATDPGFSATATIGTTTVAENGSLAIAVAGNLGATATWPGGWTERYDDSTTTGHSVATQATNAGTSPGGTYTAAASGRIALTTVIIKPAAAPSGNGVVYPLIIGQLTRPSPWTRFVSLTPLMLQEYRVTIDGEPAPILSVEETPKTATLTVERPTAEPVPSLLPGDFLATVRPGKTSDPATWGGKLPTAADDVQIIHDVTIDRLTANRVEVARGTATLVDADLYGSMLVRSTLEATAGELRFHVADDRKFIGGTVLGPLPAIPALHIDDVGLWGLRGSTITLDAGKKTSWASCTPLGHFAPGQYGLMLADAYGTGTATLDRDLVGWEAGDQLALCDEQGNHTLATLTGVEGRTITYSGADDFTAKVINSGDKTAAPKVGNLTRPIRIVSADVKSGDTNHRAHTAILGDCNATFRGVEFRDLGARGKLGRYPTHWHMTTAESGLLDSCSIWSTGEPGNRFISLHHCKNVVVNDCIGFGSQGHGFFMEDGHETLNTVTNCLAIGVVGPEEIATADDAITKQTHSFWLRNGNKIEGNVAVGGNAIGHVILPIRCKPCAEAFKDVRQQVVGCEFFGGGKYGAWSMVPNVDFVGGAFVYAELAGFAVDATYGSSGAGGTAQNMLLAMNGNASADPYISQIYLNRTATGVRMIGLSLHGKKALHVHYNVTCAFDDCLFNVGTLLTPTYWESFVDISGSSITAPNPFDKAYPKRQNKIGRLSIVDSSYTLGPLTGDDDLVFIGMAFKASEPGEEFGVGQGKAWRVK